MVFLELCRSRLGILELSEEKILAEAKDVGFQKLQQAIQRVGLDCRNTISTLSIDSVIFFIYVDFG